MVDSNLVMGLWGAFGFLIGLILGSVFTAWYFLGKRKPPTL